MRSLMLGLAGLVLASSTAVQAQAYPAKPVRTIVPYQAGTATDIAARFFSDAFTKAFGQSFIVDNRVGVNGNIGAAAVAKSSPDGYTLLMGTAGTHSMNPHLYQTLGFDPEADFEPVALVAVVPLVIAANASFPATSVQELLAAAKAKPNSINVAHPSVTSLIALEYLKQRGGAPLFGVPYKGSATALADVAGGQVPVIIDSIAAVLPFLTSGRLRPIAVTSLAATDLLPGVRSVAEQGLPGFEFVGWIAFFAPKGTPPQVVNLLNAELVKFLADPGTRKRVLDFGMQPVNPGPPKQFAEFIRAERDKWGQMIKAANITPQ